MMERDKVIRLMADIYEFIKIADDLGEKVESDIYLHGGIPPYKDYISKKYSFKPTDDCLFFDYKRHALNLLWESIIDKYATKECVGDADELTTALFNLNKEIQNRKDDD